MYFLQTHRGEWRQKRIFEKIKKLNKICKTRFVIKSAIIGFANGTWSLSTNGDFFRFSNVWLNLEPHSVNTRCCVRRVLPTFAWIGGKLELGDVSPRRLSCDFFPVTTLAFYAFVRRVGRTKTESRQNPKNTYRWKAAAAEGRAAGPCNRYLGRPRCRAPCRRPAAKKLKNCDNL